MVYVYALMNASRCGSLRELERESGCSFVRLVDRRGRKLWILKGNAPTKTAEDNNKGAICVEINALMSKIHSEQVVIVGIDANAKMGLERQSNVLGKCGAQMR
ncbi:hypothetical protein RB195_018626 [Necator americanus]|uniref:Uncharacterized protein n=1 Tax=Necator americanus TaxID=51031 RepID=A0ABR1CAK9_NECAM